MGRWFSRFLTPTGKNEFYMHQDYANGRFQRNAAGTVTGAIWQWPSGDPVTFLRLEK
ncbi:MAG TPA: hypothetical protein VKU01_34185 [Bryobacteraceae bacterium]|nr:hypothetical protein [Bryobacteraceae bacterium]